jgi:hypothetical protein
MELFLRIEGRTPLKAFPTNGGSTWSTRYNADDASVFLFLLLFKQFRGDRLYIVIGLLADSRQATSNSRNSVVGSG